MKETIFIIILLLAMISCSTNSNQEIKEIKNQEIKSRYNGKWILVEYLDNIVKEKTIAKYRMIKPSWFAIMIDIDAEMLNSYGSIYKQVDTISEYTNDTLTIFSNFVQVSWSLVYNNDSSNIEIVNLDSIAEKYHYRRMTKEEFRILKIDTAQFFPLQKSVNKYFKQEIFTGKYFDPENNDTIIFHKTGNITGSRKYIKYEIKDYFGTCHLFRNFDMIQLYNIDTIPAYLNWAFEGEYLIFKWFTRDVNEDIFDITDKSFKFKLIKK